MHVGTPGLSAPLMTLTLAAADGPLKALVVSVDAAWRLQRRVQLEADGYVVTEAERPDEAGGLARAEHIDLVFMQVHVGREDGDDERVEKLLGSPSLEGIPIVLTIDGRETVRNFLVRSGSFVVHFGAVRTK